MVESKYILDESQVKEIRHALLIGLASYGEIERLSNDQELYKVCGDELPEGCSVIHPTGAADTVCDFATALRNLEYAEEKPAA